MTRGFGYRDESRQSFVLALIVVSALAFAMGCASTPAGKAYQSISACNATEQTAMAAFGVLYQANKAANPVLWGDHYDKAMAAHASYEKIRDAAVDAAKAGGDLQVTAAAVNEALNALQVLLATLGVK